MSDEVCVWNEDWEGNWFSACGTAWQFTDGGPEENECVYCHKCGKKIEVTHYEPEPEDEE